MNVGTIFGDWTVIERAGLRTRKSGMTLTISKCRCACGVIKIVENASLLRGHSKGCGHRKHLTGDKNPGWRGGKYRHKAGYIVVPGIKVNKKTSPRLEQSLIVEKVLGRPLIKGETVHHKNGIRDDNRIENLELWASGHPGGQRVSDLVPWALEILKRYKPEALK